MTMTSTEFDRLITALTDGSHPKGKGQLLDSSGGYCCLGVDCHINGGLDLNAIPHPNSGPFATAAWVGGVYLTRYQPYQVVQLLESHFTRYQREQLTHYNDHSDDFSEVVEYLRSHRHVIVAD